MSKKPTVKKDKQDYLSPDMDFLKMMNKVIVDQDAVGRASAKNVYNGFVLYRVLGSTIMEKKSKKTKSPPKSAPIKDFDINQMTADPFYDATIDNQRVKNRGTVPFTDIAPRVTLFMQSDGLYNVVFDTTTNLKIKASFLLRVDLSRTKFKSLKQAQITKNAGFDFKFSDRENLRGPALIRASAPRTP